MSGGPARLPLISHDSPAGGSQIAQYSPRDLLDDIHIASAARRFILDDLFCPGAGLVRNAGYPNHPSKELVQSPSKQPDPTGDRDQELIAADDGSAGLAAGMCLAVIGFYQRAISPLTPPTCRFRPTCSRYARLAIKRHGFWRGGWMALKRLMRCHPFHPGGYDPVP